MDPKAVDIYGLGEVMVAIGNQLYIAPSLSSIFQNKNYRYSLPTLSHIKSCEIRE